MGTLLPTRQHFRIILIATALYGAGIGVRRSSWNGYLVSIANTHYTTHKQAVSRLLALWIAVLTHFLSRYAKREAYSPQEYAMSPLCLIPGVHKLGASRYSLFISPLSRLCMYVCSLHSLVGQCRRMVLGPSPADRCWSRRELILIKVVCAV